MAKLPDILPAGYEVWLKEIKLRIAGARQRASLSINAEQVRLYHSLGREILERQRRNGWGAKVIDRLSRDLRAAFPEMKGFSGSNLKYMRFFAYQCPDLQFGQQSADQLPWFHIVALVTRIPDAATRAWYAHQAADKSWSRDTLTANIRDKLHLRLGSGVSNFKEHLPPAQAGLATAILKDPYHFDFLSLGEEAQERDIEAALIQHIMRFLLELGAGFAFVGRQFRLEVAGDEFFLDLLFYHTRLKCYVVVELKASAFKPGHAGQLNFYLSAVDAQIKAPDDKPTIGLLLCKTKNRLVAEYALAGMNKPMGVAEYRLVRALPKSLNRALPAIAELEAELSRELHEAHDVEKHKRGRNRTAKGGKS
jgi:predicted nuclease of restriction endonuclease-like (RecB) superfamily